MASSSKFHNIRGQWQKRIIKIANYEARVHGFEDSVTGLVRKALRAAMGYAEMREPSAKSHKALRSTEAAPAREVLVTSVNHEQLDFLQTIEGVTGFKPHFTLQLALLRWAGINPLAVIPPVTEPLEPFSTSDSTVIRVVFPTTLSAAIEENAERSQENFSRFLRSALWHVMGLVPKHPDVFKAFPKLRASSSPGKARTSQLTRQQHQWVIDLTYRCGGVPQLHLIGALLSRLFQVEATAWMFEQHTAP